MLLLALALNLSTVTIDRHPLPLAPSAPKMHTAWLIAPIACQAVDALSARYSYTHNPQFQEQMPLSRALLAHPGKYYSMKLGQGILAGATVKLLSIAGKPGLAKALSGGMCAVGLYGAASNFDLVPFPHY